MTYKEKINLFESIELEGIRHLFENPTSFNFTQNVTIEKQIDDYYIELSFIVTGRNIKPRFGKTMIIDDVTIEDVKVWLNDDDLAVISDSDLVKLEKILTTKMKEL